MKCELCHEAEAATVLHRKGKDGADEELFVCKACAAAARAPGKGKKTDAPQESPKREFSLKDGEPPPFVENFVKAALGLVEGIASQEKAQRKCPGCGFTWERIQKEHLVGCPRCYRTFAQLIRDEFLKPAYGRVHQGDAPKNVAVQDTRPYLERALKTAVRRQEFEKAAELRRRLDALKDADGGRADAAPKKGGPA